MSKRYAVLDKDGLVINHILIADPMPKGYWPGYGATLVPLEDADTSASAGLNVVHLKIIDIPQIGDTLDIATGNLTKFEPKLVEDVETKELYAPAPEQKFIADADPKTEKLVVDAKQAIEVKVPVEAKAPVNGGKGEK